MEVRTAFANEVRLKIKRPNKEYAVELKKRRAVIDKSITKENHKLIKAQSDVEKLTAELAKDNIALGSAPPVKTPALQKKIEKVRKELEEKHELSISLATKSQDEKMPEIRQTFDQYEKDRLKRMKANSIDFGALKQTMESQVNETTQLFLGKTKRFDDVDIQRRFMGSAVAGKIGKQVEKHSDRKSTLLKKKDKKKDKKREEEDAPDPTVWGYALCDFNSEEVSDLTFASGDKIKCLAEHLSGWWDGELDGRQGLFPRNYVWIPGRDSIQGHAINAFSTCMQSYVGNELSLYCGDEVYVEIIKDDQFLGTSKRTGQKGWVPLDLIYSTN